MKRKAAILILAALLLFGAAQAGFASAGDETITRIKEACRDFWAGLSPEQQEQVEEAREDFHDQMEALRQEYHSKRAALKGEFLDKLPEEVRSELEDKMATRAEERNTNRHGNRLGGKNKD